ncbi:hypothetical protein DA102_023805 [Sinorhizobium meliloti]|nr:hypothetical protein DA102_023805 [Sinorhizobium meliloti]
MPLSSAALAKPHPSATFKFCKIIRRQAFDLAELLASVGRMVDVFSLGRCGKRQSNGNKHKEQDSHGDPSWN